MKPSSARPRPRRVGRSEPLKWRVSDAMWERLEPILTDPPRRFRYPGRARYSPRQCLEGILYVLYTDTPWLQVPLPGARPAKRRDLPPPTRGMVAARPLRAGDPCPAGAAGGGRAARLVAGDRRCLADRREKGGDQVARTQRGRPGSRYHLAVDARGAPLEVRLAPGNEKIGRAHVCTPVTSASRMPS